ncbi:MAG: diguanylate cyclase [Syntrophobacteraceae bacterium]
MHSDQRWPKLAPQSILVVDDEEQVCDLLAEALTFMGHTVKTASDGLKAVQEMEQGPFAIVITDMDMPRMDGMELIKYIVENRNGTDIIAITGHTMRYKYTDVVAAGAGDFITKPFTLNELEAKVNRLLRERFLRHELELLAVRDPLTSLYNRRFFQKSVRKESIRAERYGHPLFLFYCDIDQFKEYNDRFGHQAGDVLLTKLADILKSAIREGVDSAYRFGGDEFTVLLPYLPRDKAVSVAERIRQRYSALGADPSRLSIGIARFLCQSGNLDKDIEDMIRRADAALYYAKGSLGGDRVHLDEASDN